LVDTRKKTRDNTSSSSKADNNNKNFGTDSSNNSSTYNNNVFDDIDSVRYFDILCYKDICLLVVQSPDKREQDILAIEVKIAYYKGYNRYPKP
jgi:hypothetical protein